MKLIPFSACLDAYASSENPSWPASNVVEAPVKKMWLASSPAQLTAWIVVQASGWIDTVAIFGIAADAIVVTITDPNLVEWEDGTEWEAGTTWQSNPAQSPQPVLLDNLAGSSIASGGNLRASAWFEFEEFFGSVLIAIGLENQTGRPLTLGIGTVWDNR